MLKMIFAIGAVLMLFGTNATAQTRTAVKVCAADVETHCGQLPPGSRELTECVQTHQKDFSQPCQAAMQQASTVAKECDADIKQSCSNVKPGGGRIERCLRAHLTGLGAGCKAAVSGIGAGLSREGPGTSPARR
jgi:hypothetical protein